MRNVHLDFLRPRPSPGWSAWVVFVAGLLLFVAVAVWAYIATKTSETFVADGRQRLSVLQEKISANRPKGVLVSSQKLPEEWNRAIKVSRALNSPWPKLFEMLEGEVDRPVALLNLEADAVRQEVVIFAEAKNFDEMTAYLNFLKTQPYLTDATLQAHQINQQDREKPVRFRVTAGWKE